jgi:hypothetical protein
MKKLEFDTEDMFKTVIGGVVAIELIKVIKK